MRRKRSALLLILLLLLVLFAIYWLRKSGTTVPLTTENPIPITVSKPQAPIIPALPHLPTLPKPPLPKPVKVTPKQVPPKKVAPEGPSGRPTPPKIELHKELIPKNIEIVRCYYNQEITPPGVTFGFDINGSGFTSEFEKMIKVKVENAGIRVKNLKLATANQIHGDLEVGPEAATAFSFPRVLIKDLPVFSAPDPFAIVRKGEVLTVIFISMEENGRAGRFRVITNLDEELFKQFRVEPSTPGLQISAIEPHLPYAVEGTLRIGQGVPPGEYGLVVKVAEKEVYRRNGMIRIVRPNIGQSGFIQGLRAEDLYHRPGDEIQVYVQGSGLSRQDAEALEGQVDGYAMGRGTFTFLSGAQMRLVFNAPPSIPVGTYGVTVSHSGGPVLFQKKDVFKIVPPNWVVGVQVSPPVRAGGKSLLKIVGRDLSSQWMEHLHIDLDEPGISISGLHRVDSSTLAADISVKASVAPGDYWLHLSVNGRKIDPPFGSIIKVEPSTP